MSGFQHAPVTKGMMIITAISSLAVSIADLKPYVHLPLVPHLTRDHQLYRLVIHQVVFQNSVELLMAELSLYQMGRYIERSFGSRKYSAFVLATAIFSTTLSLFFLLIFHKLGLKYIPAGCFGVVGALAYQYSRSVPTLYAFRICGIPFSSKTFAYAYPFFMLLHQFPIALIAMLPGLLFGKLYRSETPLLPARLQPSRFRIPSSIYNLLSRILSPLFVVDPAVPPRRADRVLPPEFTDRRRDDSARAVAEMLGRGMFGAGGQAQPTRRSTAEQQATAAAVAQAVQERLAATLSPQTATGGTASATTAGDASAAPTTGSTTTSPQPDAPRRTFGLPVAAWMNQMTGSGGEGSAAGQAGGVGATVRAPTEVEIEALSNMFPNLSRDTVVRALQRSDHNSALAVEMLLDETS